MNELLKLGTTAKDLREFSSAVLQAATELTIPSLDPPRAAVLVPHPSGDLQVAFYFGASFELGDTDAILERGKGVAGATFSTGEIVYMKKIPGKAIHFDLRNPSAPRGTEKKGCFQDSGSGMHFTSVLCLPIEGSEGRLGVLSLDASRPILGDGLDLDAVARARTFALVLGLAYSRYYAEWSWQRLPRP